MEFFRDLEFSQLIILLLVVGAIVSGAFNSDYTDDFIGAAFLVWIFA